MKLFSLKLVMLLCVIQGTIQVAIAADAQEGDASYYSDSLNGNNTAGDEPCNKNELSAAHPTLPFGTKVRVTCLKTGQSVEVIINDRGPHAKDRITDLSGAAAKKMGLIDAGHGKVRQRVPC